MLISSMNSTRLGPTNISPVQPRLILQPEQRPIMHERKSADVAGVPFANAHHVWMGRGMPEVTRFFWPPLTPRRMALPMMVSAQMSSPSTSMMACAPQVS